MRVSEHGGGPTQAVLALSRDPNLELPPGIGLPLLPVAMARSPPRPPLLPSLARAAGGVPPLPPLADPSMVADGGAMGGPCELGPRPQPHPQQQLLHGTACGAAPAEKAAAVDDCAKNPDELLRHANPAAAGGGVGLDRGAPVQGPAGSVLGSGSARAPPAGSLLAAGRAKWGSGRPPRAWKPCCMPGVHDVERRRAQWGWWGRCSGCGHITTAQCSSTASHGGSRHQRCSGCACERAVSA